MHATVLLLLLLSLAALASATSYHGYRVVSVQPSTQTEVDLMSSLVKRHRLQQWTHSHSPGVPIDVLVPPRSVRPLLSTLRKHRVPVITRIDDVQRVIDQQMHEHRSRALESLPGSFDHTKYHRIDEIYSILDQLVKGNSVVTTYTAGTTHEGRDIRVVKVSSGGKKRAIWIDCGIHAREWISPATCLYILDQLTSGNDAGLLDTYDFHIMPSANPDGYHYTWTDDRLWRKNRIPNDKCDGVDLNRNFDAHFGGRGTSDDPCSEVYHGPEAFSEAESRAMRDAVKALDAKVYFTIHSYSQMWMTPYGYTHNLPANYKTEQYRVAEVAVRAIKAVHGATYKHGNTADVIYMATGISSDWAYDGAGIQYAFALELRDTGDHAFLLPAKQIIPTGEETYAGVVAAIKAVQ